jgi:hypothetical protein
MATEMDMGYNITKKMVINMKDNGKIIFRKGLESNIIDAVKKCIKGNGKNIKNMAEVLCIIRIKVNTMGNSKTVKNVGMVFGKKEW